MKTHEYLQFFAWGGHNDKKEVHDLLVQRRPRIIEYISPEEWEPHNPITDVLFEYADNNDCELRMLLSGLEKWRYPALRPTLRNVTYEDNPTLAFYYVLNSYTNQFCRVDNYKNGNDVTEFNPLMRLDRVKYNVISMTNKLQRFRCQMIDHFEEYGIINDRNCIIWQNNGVLDYDYKFFKPRVITRDHFLNSNGTFNSFLLPVDFNNSWFVSTVESSPDIITMTEKVLTPILFMKPFLVLGAKGYHRFLESIGFKLFDEFIDYSFDFENDETKRVEMFAKEIKKVSEFTRDHITELANIINDKLIHNKQNLYKLYYSPIFAPRYVTGWKELGKSLDYTYNKEQGAQMNWYQNVTARGWYDII